MQLHQQKGMISLSPPTICNSADYITHNYLSTMKVSYTFIVYFFTALWG
uniref:Uncharacterized protein n=1 Tax=Escherichia coli TaxID=562 RepID=A0A6H1PTP3_ECOLX|nr:hypothetical protein [Escherichia coli]